MARWHAGHAAFVGLALLVAARVPARAGEQRVEVRYSVGALDGDIRRRHGYAHPFYPGQTHGLAVGHRLGLLPWLELTSTLQVDWLLATRSSAVSLLAVGIRARPSAEVGPHVELDLGILRVDAAGVDLNGQPAPHFSTHGAALRIVAGWQFFHEGGVGLLLQCALTGAVGNGVGGDYGALEAAGMAQAQLSVAFDL